MKEIWGNWRKKDSFLSYPEFIYNVYALPKEEIDREPAIWLSHKPINVLGNYTGWTAQSYWS